MFRSMLVVSIALVVASTLTAPVLGDATRGWRPSGNFDWTRSSVPTYVTIVGRISGGTEPDPAGLATVTVRDFTNAPAPNLLVTVDFSGCCDLHLCAAEVNGESVDVSGKLVSGYTNQAGQFHFVVMGAAGDPGSAIPPSHYPGCGAWGAQVRIDPDANPVILGNLTAVCLDLNGGAGQSNGTTGADASNLATLMGSYALGAPYRGRGDLNRNGTITAGDVAALATHVGRLVLAQGVGCTSPLGASACP